MRHRFRTKQAGVPLSQRNYRKDPWQDLLQRLAHFFLGCILVGTVWMTLDIGYDVYQNSGNLSGLLSFPLSFFTSFIVALIAGFPFLFGIGLVRLLGQKVGLFPMYSRFLGAGCAVLYFGSITLDVFYTIWLYLLFPFLGGMLGAWFAREKSLPGVPV